MSSTIKKFIIHFEEKYRFLWLTIVFLLELIALRIYRVYGFMAFFYLFLTSTMFIFLLIEKYKRETLIFLANRDYVLDIGISVVILGVLKFLTLPSSLNEMVSSYQYFFFGICTIVNIALTVKSFFERREYSSNFKFDDKVRIGSYKDGWFNKPYFIYDKESVYHQGLFGVTGSGKTVSAFYPQINHSIRTGKFTIVIEPKGDQSFRNYVFSVCKKYGRDFKFISIANSEISSKYNPFGFGDENAIKDKILTSTDWSEQFYKKIADTALLVALKKLKSEQESSVCFEKNGVDLDKIIKILPEDENLAGLNAFLLSLKLSKFSEIFSSDAPNLYDYYRDNCVLFISLDSLKYPEAAKGLGKIILQDLSTLNGHIIDTVPEKNRKNIEVFIDEFKIFFHFNFLNFMSQCRSGKIGLHLAQQSTFDLREISENALPGIIDNTSTKIIMAQGDPDGAEYLSRVGGTRKVQKVTKQTDGINNEETGRGSLRTGHEFFIDPNAIKELQTGESFIVNRLRKSKEKVILDEFYFDDTEILEYDEDPEVKKMRKIKEEEKLKKFMKPNVTLEENNESHQHLTKGEDNGADWAEQV